MINTCTYASTTFEDFEVAEYCRRVATLRVNGVLIGEYESREEVLAVLAAIKREVPIVHKGVEYPAKEAE